MYMVGHNFQLDHSSLELLSNLVNDLFQTLVHTLDQHLAAIFRTPDNVIFTRIDHIAIAFEVMCSLLEPMC